MWNDIVLEWLRKAGRELDVSAARLGKLLLDGPSKLLILNQILQSLKYRSIEERLELSLSLYSDSSSEDAPRQMLKPEDLSKLADFGIEFGAPTR